MNLMIGNLSVDQMESRLGIEFPADIKAWMKENHQSNAANVAAGKWHCFDVPFCLDCGDMETATKIFESVKDRANEVIEPLQIALQKGNS